MVYYIGGASCAGKTTIAKIIAEKHNMNYFSADQSLAASLKSNKNKETIKYLTKSNNLVSLHPSKQADLMISVYHEIFDSIMSTIRQQLQSLNTDIIAEGTVFLSELMKNKNNYIILIPTENFLRKILPKRNYVKRESNNNPYLIDNILQRTIHISECISENAQNYNIPIFQNDNNLDNALLFAEKTFNL